MNNYSCILCGSTSLQLINIPSHLPCVSSDDKPLQFRFQLLVCNYCGHIQKHISEKFLNQIDKIYKAYELYRPSSGKESLIFGGSEPATRSLAVIEFLSSLITLTERGTLLDFGCGNGAALTSFKKKFPNWDLSAYDNNLSCEKQIAKLDTKINFYTSSVFNIKNKFDLIIANYVMEHVLDPKDTILKLRSLLKEDGILVVTVPFFKDNSFDLMVLDHCSHFTESTMAQLADFASLSVLKIETTCIKRSIVAIFKNQKIHKHIFFPTYDIQNNIVNVDKSISWLNRVYSDIKSFKGEIAMFGTATASGWFTGIISNRIKYYVDEDSHRAGKTHFGKSILKPSDALISIPIYLGLPYSLAIMLKQRLQKKYPLIKFIMPPHFYENFKPYSLKI